MRKILAVIVLLLLFLFFARSAGAADFSSKYNVTYELQQEGYTKVTQEIEVTNLVAEYYLSKFTIDMGPQQVVNAQATEKNKELRTSLIQNATSSAITVEFADKTVGRGSTKKFTLQYESVNTLEKNGNIKAVTIPKITGTSIQEYNVSIVIPKEMGETDSISPTPHETTEGDATITLLYDRSEILENPITLTIGNEQYYTLGLTYHLRNPQSKAVFTEIALPMNTPYQKIIYENLNPSPSTITVDDDGNYIARYTLQPRQEMDVQFTGKAIVYKQKQYEEPKLTAQKHILYTQKQKYWETDDLDIATLAASLRTPENIYNYVVETLQYDTEKLGSSEVGRQGAAQILGKPELAVCMEFTDLFIALARAAGIPAREINGFAYTTDPVTRPVSLSQDILHAWPEYYDEERGWVQVDPTWQNTTNGVDYFNSFDLNHVAFVRKGMSSEYPYPAGSYKGSNTDTRDVLVSFSETVPEIKEDFAIVPQSKQTIFAGKSVDLAIMVKNNGNTGLQLPAVKKATKKSGNTTSEETVIIPPFSQTPVSLLKYQTTAIEDDVVKGSLTLKDQTATIEAVIIPWYKSIWVYMGILYAVGIPILAYILYTRLHQKSLEKRNLV